jgi:hypothetical protein
MSDTKELFRQFRLETNNPRRLFMTKTKGFLLTAGILLATTFTLSCSEEEGGSYLSCEEVGSLMQSGFMGGDPDTYMDNLKSSCETKHMSELQNCNRDRQCGINIVMACMEKDENVKKLCGGGLEACGNHYDTTCGFGD